MSQGFTTGIPLSTDTSLAADSNGLVSSQHAVKTYVDTANALDEKTANKDATGGYAGLTLFKINFKNVLNTFTSFFTNSNTAARTYTFQDRNGTIADDTDLGLKANLASPTFTGNPLAPTPTAGDNDTSIATTAFVTTAINNSGSNIFMAQNFN